MGITVNSRPLTNYIAVKNPCLYKFQRKDYPVASVANSGGKIQIVINGVDVTTSLAVGTKGWFQSDNGVYNLAVSVFSVSFAVNSTVTFNEAYTSAATTGFVNSNFFARYALEVETYLSPSNTLIAKYNYPPDQTGLIKCDVSTIVRSQIAPDISLGTTTYGAYTWNSDDAVATFYVKYREVWTGSANGQTDDVGNLRNAVYAANQIGEGSNQLTYPSVLGNIYAVWKYPYNFFTYLNDNTGNRYLRLTENGISFYVVIQQYTGLKSIAWEGFYNSWVNQTATAAIDWTNINSSQNQVILAIGQTSEDLTTLVRADNVSFDLGYTISMTATGTFTLSFLVYSESNVLLTTINIPIVAVAGTQVGKTTINLVGIVKKIDARISAVATAGQTIALRTSIELSSAATAAIITTTNAPPTVDTLVQTLPNVKIMDACSNPYNVVWRNRYGGLTNYVFQSNQDFYWRFDDNKKKQLVLYAEQLSDDQIEQLEDLNQTGEIYKIPYDELPYNAIQKKIGSQAYVVSSAGGLTCIVVNPTSNKYRTQAVKSRSNFTIELPETIN